MSGTGLIEIVICSQWSWQFWGNPRGSRALLHLRNSLKTPLSMYFMSWCNHIYLTKFSSIIAFFHVGYKERQLRDRVAIISASTRIMNIECSACHLDADFLSQGSGTPTLYLTRCGHICCDMCRINWFASGRETCPKCRQPQTRSNLIRIYYDIAQHTQPSASSTEVVAPREPEADLQVSSEHFLEAVADQATDIFGACVLLSL